MKDWPLSTTAAALLRWIATPQPPKVKIPKPRVRFSEAKGFSPCSWTVWKEHKRPGAAETAVCWGVNVLCRSRAEQIRCPVSFCCSFITLACKTRSVVSVGRIKLFHWWCFITWACAGGFPHIWLLVLFTSRFNCSVSHWWCCCGAAGYFAFYSDSSYNTVTAQYLSKDISLHLWSSNLSSSYPHVNRA